MSQKRPYKESKKSGGKKLTMLQPIADYSSRKEWEENSLQKILESKELLSILLTSYERHNLVIRAAVLQGLDVGKGHRQLSRELFVSLQTINSVKKASAENNYRSYSERSKKERKKRKYSTSSFGTITKRRGRPVRTKYGIVHMPY